MATVRSTDGLELYVETSGDPEAPPVVLLHGYPDTSSVWFPVARLLAVDHLVIAPDVRRARALAKQLGETA